MLESKAAALAASPAGTAMAYPLLVFTMACWGGNSVAGRLAVGQVSPMVITSLRWGLVSLALAVVTGRQLLLFRGELVRHWRRIAFMAASGFSMFNALFYVAAHHTTAVNISLLQASVPVLVVIGAVLLHRTRISAVQIAGIATTLVGVAVIATHGDLAHLAALQLNFGDGLMLIASGLYAGYTLALRQRLKMPNLVFFTALAMFAFLTSLPLLAYEWATGTEQWPTPNGWAVVAFITVFPSFAAQMAFMRAVQLIGPARAGLFANLVPVLGALMAVVILGESFSAYHLIALVLVLAGIVTAELGRRSERPAG